MNQDPAPRSRLRRTWLAIVVGALSLLIVFLASLVAEPYLIVLASDSTLVEPRSSAGGWANSNTWLVATSSTFIVLALVGWIAKRLSPSRSKVAVISLFSIAVGYVFFAQFPATKSLVRIGFWSIGLPASFVLGAWLASRGRSEA